MAATVYGSNFYTTHMDDSLASARVILPALFAQLRPRSLVDVGCGVGTWLMAAQELGVDDVLGMDGAYVDRRLLKIPPERFVETDLAAGIPQRRRYDLAMCLEVAEHLRSTQAARLVGDLVGLSDAVLFSAALPYQGGTGHYNENWLGYWTRLFEAHGYELFDLIRPVFWDDRRVCFWYRQNAVVYVKRESAATLLSGVLAGPRIPLSAVHPEMYLHAVARGTALPDDRLRDDIAYYRQLATTASPSDERLAALDYGSERFLDWRGFSVRRALKKVAVKICRLGI